MGGGVLPSHTTLEQLDWFDHRRLLGPIGHLPPAEFEAAHYRKEAAATLPNSSTRASVNSGRFSYLGAHAITEAQVCNTLPDAGPRVTVERLAPFSSVYVRPSEKV